MTRMLTWLFNQSVAAQNVIAWAMVLLFVSVAALTGFAATDYAHDRRAEVQEKRELLARLERTVTMGASVQEIPNAVSTNTGFFLEGDSAANASANLHAMIGGLADANSTDLSSVVTLPEKSSGDVKLVGLKVIISGELEDVHKVVFALETATPPLIIDTLSLQAIPQRGKNAPAKMAVNLNVLGVLAPQKKSGVNAS